jgi:glutathionylspermidine synthase
MNDETIRYAKDNQREVEEDYQKKLNEVAHSNAVYKGKPLPFLYYPSLYSEEDLRRFETMTKKIFDLVNQSIDIYLKHEEVRPIWGFSKELEELVLLPHDYSANVPMGRFDFFYYPDGHYEFCELNTDGTSAMNEETPLTDILLTTKAMDHLLESYDYKRFELYDSWVDEVGSIYEEFLKAGHEPSDQAFVIIMDFMEKGSPHEFEVFKGAFEKKGYLCEIVSPDQVDYKNGYLYYDERKVDIIYRRLVTRDMMESYEDLRPLIQGIKANKTCIIGSIKSQIVHTKKYFEALHHPLVRQYFDDETLKYIDAHIPFTKTLTGDEDYAFYIAHKDDYIIKPIDYYASKGVYAGNEQDEETWARLIKEGMAKGYVIQKFCKKAQNQNLYFDDQGHMHVKTMNNITGVFVYNEKLKGVFTRAGMNSVISDLNDGYSLSSLVMKKK